MLIAFSITFAADPQIIFSYNFVAQSNQIASSKQILKKHEI